MRSIRHLALLCLAAIAATPTAAQQPAATVTISRLEGGTQAAPIDVNQRFSDTSAFKNLMLPFVYSAYLIKHGDDYMLWDTGQASTAGPVAPKVNLVDQLAKAGIKPEQIKMIGISHFHSDHIGGASAFPAATLVIGKGDWDVLTRPKPPGNLNPALLSPWIGGTSKVEPIDNDKDVFGDGSVVMLYTPGHTPGHHSLLVRLPKTGAIIISGDAIHFRENFEKTGVPFFNADRAQTIASIDRIKGLMANLDAKLIIQHDARDVDKIPAFPASAD